MEGETEGHDRSGTYGATSIMAARRLMLVTERMRARAATEPSELGRETKDPVSVRSSIYMLDSEFRC